jgi:hypothetical protein
MSVGAARANVWSGDVVRRARAVMAPRLPAPCGRCGETVERTDAWVVGHVKSRLAYPELTLVPSNWRIEHRACSDASSGEAIAEKALRDAGFSPSDGGQTGVALPFLSPEPSLDLSALIDALPSPEETIAAQPWTADLLPIWEDASLPLAMTGPHPRAVGSYGPACIEWAETVLGRRVIGGDRMRWWQRLTICRLLEHDTDGALVWRQLIKSASRRSGKSVLLRVIALWRIAHADLIGEPQELMLTSKDLKVAREIIRPAWFWALMPSQKEAGWNVLRGNGSEEVSSPSDDRWLVRASDGVYGYSPGLGMADEAWGIPPDAITEGLEPALLERLWPQLVLTSTAHVRATSLMRRRLLAALRGDDPFTLLLLWGARPGCDPGDPAVWRAASPYWSPARHAMMVSKYAAALAGEDDPEFDDPDPMRGFMAQFLNVWPLVSTKQAPGEPLVTPEDWQALTPERFKSEPLAPAAVAVESWPGGGVSVVAAWRLEDGRTLVSASGHPDVADAAAAARAWGCRAPILVGKSLTSDPAFKGIRTKPQTGTVVAAVSDLGRWIEEGVLVHDGGEHLGVQVTGMRTKATGSGLRVVSAGAADALKAASWAVAAARHTSVSKPRVILPPGLSA